MTKFVISAGAIVSEYVAETEQDAVASFVADAGYSSIEDAADACGKTPEEFLGNIRVEAVA